MSMRASTSSLSHCLLYTSYTTNCAFHLIDQSDTDSREHIVRLTSRELLVILIDFLDRLDDVLDHT